MPRQFKDMKTELSLEDGTQLEVESGGTQDSSSALSGQLSLLLLETVTKLKTVPEQGSVLMGRRPGLVPGGVMHPGSSRRGMAHWAEGGARWTGSNVAHPSGASRPATGWALSHGLSKLVSQALRGSS